MAVKMFLQSFNRNYWIPVWNVGKATSPEKQKDIDLIFAFFFGYFVWPEAFKDKQNFVLLQVLLFSSCFRGMCQLVELQYLPREIRTIYMLYITHELISTIASSCKHLCHTSYFLSIISFG